MIKRWLHVFFVILLVCELSAQQTSTFSQYIFNRGMINPAYPGSKKCSEFFFTDRHQLVGFGGAPSLQTLSGYYVVPSKKDVNNGLGINLMNDWNGAYRYLSGELMYAFHFLVNRRNNLRMGLGLSGIVRQETLDERDFSPIPDPVIHNGIEWQFIGNAATGIHIYNDNFFISIAAYYLIPASAFKEGRNYLFNAGYLTGNSRKPFRYQPSVYFQSNQVMNIADVIQKFIYREKFWLGLQFRKYFTTYESSSQNAIVFAGVDLNNWSLGYAFDLGINKLQRHHFGGHLLKIGYQICRDSFTCPAY